MRLVQRCEGGVRGKAPPSVCSHVGVAKRNMEALEEK